MTRKPKTTAERSRAYRRRKTGKKIYEQQEKVREQRSRMRTLLKRTGRYKS